MVVECGGVWYKNVKVELKRMGYSCTKADHAVFICYWDGVVSIIVLYVDDFTLVCENINVILRDKEALKTAYNMTDLSELMYILSMHIMQDHKAGQTELLQECYIEDILEHYGKSDVHPINTPVLTNEHLSKLTTPEIDVKLFQHALGAIMYPMLGTWPDLAYTVRALKRYAATPSNKHQWALNWVFCYLWVTKDWCLVYQHSAPEGLTLTGYVDTDWANNLGDCKSTSGYMFKLAGGAISWSSKKQPSVMLSSTEAKYIARAHAAKELVWLQHLFSKVGLPNDDLTILFMDNQSAIAIAKNPQFHNWMKHIEVQHHFLHDKVKQEELKLEYIPTIEQVANIMTKALNWKKHSVFTKEMGVHHPAWGGMLKIQAVDGDVIWWHPDVFLVIISLYIGMHKLTVFIIAVSYNCTLSPFFRDWGELHFFQMYYT